MGLDTSHDCWHGPYSAFHQFRVELAIAAGIPVVQEKSDSPMEDRWVPRWKYVLPWDEYDSLGVDYIHGYWNGQYPEDPLIILLAHSDCEGILPTEICDPLADRLEELLPNLESRDFPKGPREQAVDFIHGLRKAAMRADVEFH